MSSGRVIFVDLARALAIIMMVYGHAGSTLLAPEYRAGLWYEIWQFQRGLTSVLFLLLSGFAFSVATSRHWAAHARVSPALWRRLRRFAGFILLGYALHLPVGQLADLFSVSDERWRTFVAVDVLQLIGTSLVGLQLLVLAVGTRTRFTRAAFLLAAAVVLATPFIVSADWTTRFPPIVAAYFSPCIGSQFPLFPWAAYILIGAGAGQIYTQIGAERLATFAHGMLMAGAALVVLAGVLLLTLFGNGQFAGVDEVVTRTGACFLLLGLLAHASSLIGRLPHVVGAIAQESLLVYFVHLCIVYGSVWNRGLAQPYGEALAPGPTVLIIVALLLAMTAMAWQWNSLKHTRPRAARWIAVAAVALLVIPLL